MSCVPFHSGRFADVVVIKICAVDRTAFALAGEVIGVGETKDAADGGLDGFVGEAGARLAQGGEHPARGVLGVRKEARLLFGIGSFL